MGIWKRKKETVVYLCLWIIAIILYLVSEFRDRTELNLPLLDIRLFTNMATTLVPFIILFVINNFILIPKYLLTNKFGKYIASTIIIVSLLTAFEVTTGNDMSKPPEIKTAVAPTGKKPRPHNAHGHPRPHKPPKPFSPLPFVFDLTYALLIIGGNGAIALVFQRYDDRLEKEKLMKSNAENQLTYLKAQISPHFYMNMLNNIHGMIEIDPEKAQSMVLDMSRLMRHMLYESSKPLIFLENEIKFLVNYIELMKLRYDKDKVKITYDFPDENATRGIKVPPLLFVSFIENAFKHGVSYQKESFISVSIAMSGRRLHFSCMNTVSPTSRTSGTGVGLKNVRQRLELLYGDKAELLIGESPETYTVTLSIPYDENPDSNH